MFCVCIFCRLYHLWLCTIQFPFSLLLIIVYFGKFVYNLMQLVVCLLFPAFHYLLPGESFVNMWVADVFHLFLVIMHLVFIT